MSIIARSPHRILFLSPNLILLHLCYSFNHSTMGSLSQSCDRLPIGIHVLIPIPSLFSLNPNDRRCLRIYQPAGPMVLHYRPFSQINSCALLQRMNYNDQICLLLMSKLL